MAISTSVKKFFQDTGFNPLDPGTYGTTLMGAPLIPETKKTRTARFAAETVFGLNPFSGMGPFRKKRERPQLSQEQKDQIAASNLAFLQNVALASMPEEGRATLLKSIFGSDQEGIRKMFTGEATQRDRERYTILATQGPGALEVLKAREQVLAERTARPGRTQTILTRRD